MKLFIKTYCPWCDYAETWLKKNDYDYEVIDVRKDPAAFQEMQRISGQTSAPVLQLEDGRVLADFGPEELGPFLKED